MQTSGVINKNAFKKYKNTYYGVQIAKKKPTKYTFSRILCQSTIQPSSISNLPETIYTIQSSCFLNAQKIKNSCGTAKFFFHNAVGKHTHPFNDPFSGTTQVSWYQKAKTNLDFSEARDSEWQWHQLDHMQVCTLLQTDNHTSTPPLCFLQAGCPSCRPTNSVKALRARSW